MFVVIVSGLLKIESDGLKLVNYKVKCVLLMVIFGIVIVGSENEILDWDCNFKMILIKKKIKV